MPSFHYANPPTIHWGEGCVAEKLASELDGAKRIFFVTTQSALRDPALAEAVLASLGARIAGKLVIAQHAPVQSLADGIEAARNASADALLSLGGGSPIDAAKAIAFALATGIDVRARDAQARSKGASFAGVLRHVAIPTTLSVAELSGSAGFSAEGTKAKIGVAHPALRPAAVLYDAAFAVRTPLQLWLTTGVRAIDHAVETLLAAGEHPLPDLAAADGLRRLRRGLLAAKERPDDRAARTECQLGAWFSYLLPGPAASGLSHTLGKRLGSRFGIPHGVTSCLLLPHVLRYLAPRAPRAASVIADALGGGDAAAALSALLDELGVPRHLSEWNVPADELAAAARDVASPQHPEGDLLAILRAAV